MSYPECGAILQESDEFWGPEPEYTQPVDLGAEAAAAKAEEAAAAAEAADMFAMLDGTRWVSSDLYGKKTEEVQLVMVHGSWAAGDEASTRRRCVAPGLQCGHRLLLPPAN